MALTAILEELISSCGDKPPPALGSIKSRLMDLRVEAKALEDQEATFQAQLQQAGFEKQIKNLETERDELKAQLEAANVEIDRLVEESQGGKRRTDEEEKILLFLGLAGRGHKVAGQVGHHIQRSAEYATFVLNGLQKDHLCKATPNMGMGAMTWYRTDEGNAYLAKRGLLK